MNILVTGSSGFIGSHLVKKLSDDCNNIIFSVSRNHLQKATKNFIPIFADLSNHNFTSILPKNIDVIIHLAQSREYRNFPDGSTDIFSINVQSTLKLLEWGLKTRIRKFIHFSSGNVYKTGKLPLMEDDVFESSSFYGSSKIMAEELIKNFRDFFEIIVLRPFCIFGPKQTDMLIPNIGKKILNNEVIYLASGEGLWITPLFIDDCVEYIFRFLYVTTNQSFSTFNLCGNEKLNLSQISSIIGNQLKRIPKIEINSNSPAYLMGDNSKIKFITGYLPNTPFEKGIEKTFPGN